jgi:hypothetical protein
MEHRQLYPILIKQWIIQYFCYVDSIFLIYDWRKKDIDKTLTEFNEQQPIKTFTIDKESHNFTIFLAISIHWSENEIKYII